MKPQSQFASWNKQADPSGSCPHVRHRERPLPDPEVGTVFLSPPRGRVMSRVRRVAAGWLEQPSFHQTSVCREPTRVRHGPLAGAGWVWSTESTSSLDHPHLGPRTQSVLHRHRQMPTRACFPCSHSWSHRTVQTGTGDVPYGGHFSISEAYPDIPVVLLAAGLCDD